MQEYSIVSSGSVFYIDSVMTNIAEVKDYIVFFIFLNTGRIDKGA